MKFDVIVVGGGPCGATAALFLARDGHRVGLIDPLGIGGQLINVEHIVDYPGFPTGVAGWDLAAAIGEQALAGGVELVMGTASAIRPVVGDGWRVQVDIAGHPARAVLLATGTRPTPLPGAEQLEGRGVSYCASCDGGLFAGRPVAVIGLKPAIAFHKKLNRLFIGGIIGVPAGSQNVFVVNHKIGRE